MHDDMDELSDETLRAAAQRLREPVVASAGFDDWIMREIRAGEAERLHDTAGVATRTRSWIGRRMEWVATGALLAIAAVTIIVLRMTVQVPNAKAVYGSPIVAAAPTSGVRFTFSAPGAHTVTVAGTFNGWDTQATQLQRGASGVWSVDVPLHAGRYAYMFVIDGHRWVLDPSAARDAADDFGTPNSVVMVASASGEL